MTERRQRKILTTAIIPILLCSLLAACGGSGSDTTNTTTREQSVESLDQDTSVSSIYTADNLGTTSITPTQVDLGNLATTKAMEIQDQNGMAKVGLSRESSVTTSISNIDEKLNWSSTSKGGKISSIQFISGGAYEVRIGLLIAQLPAGAIFRTYPSNNRAEASQTTGAQIQQIFDSNGQTADSTDDERMWWAPSVDGEAITLEIELPPDVSPDDLKFAIPKIIHVYTNPAAAALKANEGTPQTRAAGDSAWCELDSSCYADSAVTRNSVMLIKFLMNGAYYQCTATLLNNTLNNRVPYVATANHCISKQTVASTIESTWFFRSNSCNSLTYSSGTKSKNGATLLSSTSNPDFTLLRLNDTPPSGVTYVGWTTTKSANGSSVVGIHHPSGDLQKISFGTVRYTVNCSLNADGSISCANSSSANGNDYQIVWNKGITEVGSSGSALFNSTGKYVGLLSGGSSTCYGGEDLYSRFDLVFPNIKKWLAASAS